LPKAVRNYDGLEFRLAMAATHGFAGTFSYTYSSLWGNYTGLTTTDQSDGGTTGTGRDSPDTTRAFDEPFYYFGANGKSNNGALPTDRPSTLKGYVYYTLPWWKHQTATFGLFQTAYQGTPVGSYMDYSYGSTGPIESDYMFGRDKYVDVKADPSTGFITLGSPYTKRTPWYIQSDLSASDEIKVGDHEAIKFEASAENALNQRSVTAYGSSINSWNFETPLYPGVIGTGKDQHPVGFGDGAAMYQKFEGGFNPQTWVNGNGGLVPAVIKNSQYGQPFLFQLGRSLRLGLRYTF
jgi:hypothetical protein